MEPIRAIFVDSGAWIALVKRNDRMHLLARQYYETLYTRGTGFITSNYVVDETVTRLRYDVGLEAARDFRSRLIALTGIGRARIVWIDEGMEAEGWRIMEQYADVPLSLTDATSAVVARAVHSTRIFGFDAHFGALGFVVEPPLP